MYRNLHTRAGLRAAALAIAAAVLLTALGLASCSPGAKQGVQAAGQSLLELARAGSSMSAPWAMFGKTSLRDGRSDHHGPSSSNLKWKFSTTTAVRSEAVIGADGTIYFGTDWDSTKGTSSFYAVSSSGTKNWSYRVDGGCKAQAISNDGTVYFTTWPAAAWSGNKGANDLFALTPTGTLKWRFNFAPPTIYILAGTAVLADGTILLSSYTSNSVTGDGRLYAINPNGTQRWIYDAPGFVAIESPAVAPDGTIYLGVRQNTNDPASQSGLEALNPDGSARWFYQTPYWVQGPSVGSDGTIYLGTGAYNIGGSVVPPGALYAINSDGTLRWSHTLPGLAMFNPAIAADGTLVVSVGRRTSSDSLLRATYAVNADGTFKWAYNLSPDQGPSTMAGLDSGGNVYIAYNTGSLDATGVLTALDSNGNLRWQGQLGGTASQAPAIGADGTVYIGGDSGGNGKGSGPGLFAFGPGTP